MLINIQKFTGIITLNLQISNFYKLSILLFLLSGCQELQELKIYNSNINPAALYPENYTEKESKMKDFDKNTNIIESKNNGINSPYKIKYNFLTQLKSYLGTAKKLEIINSTEKKALKQSYYTKPIININFNIDNFIQNLTFKKKGLYYKNNKFEKSIIHHYGFLKLNKLDLIQKSNLYNFLNQPDYKRKQSGILTLQYRLKTCVIDFFYNEDNEKIIYYDVRSRKYNGILFKDDCELELNMRKIYN